MLLQRLTEYSDRLESTPPMYLSVPIRYVIELDAKGKLMGFTPTSGATGKRDRGKEFLTPHVLRSSGIAAKLLADNGEYVLGMGRDGSKAERVSKCHEAFIELVRACAEATKEPAVDSALRFLEDWDLQKASLPENFDPADNLIFRVEGVFPTDLESVRKYWARITSDKSADDANREKKAMPTMQCLICGETRPAVKRLPFKIKGLRGGQASGTALISANAAAFESYGLKESLIAPTCQECGERFAKAANALLRGENTHITIGATSYIFWTKEDCAFNPARMLSNPEPDEVRGLIESAFTGKQAATAIDEVPFYATAFSASGGRVAVRDWIDTTVGNARKNLARYFNLQRIVAPDGTEGKPFGLYALAAATVRDANKELSPNVPQALLDVALKGSPAPVWLLVQAVKRNRAARQKSGNRVEQRVTRNRAALIKMVLDSRISEKENWMTGLDSSNKNPAYLCGRLLAVIESVQRAALPELNATLTDRFFGTASSAPASVFGKLVRGAQAHFGKLRKTRRGTYEALQRRLEEVLADLPVFPRTLTLEGQGVFALGYYHQRAADRAAAIAHRLSAKEDLEEVENGGTTNE